MDQEAKRVAEQGQGEGTVQPLVPEGKVKRMNAPDRQCTPRNQPDDTPIRSLDKKEQLTWLNLTKTTRNFTGHTVCMAEGIKMTEI